MSRGKIQITGDSGLKNRQQKKSIRQVVPRASEKERDAGAPNKEKDSRRGLVSGNKGGNGPALLGNPPATGKGETEG